MKIAPRFAIEFPVTVMPDASNTGVSRLTGKSTNLSETGLGLFFVGSDLLNPGDSVSVILCLDDSTQAATRISLKGKVVWSREGSVGLQIVGMPEKSRSFYANLLAGYRTLQEFSCFSEFDKVLANVG